MQEDPSSSRITKEEGREREREKKANEENEGKGRRCQVSGGFSSSLTFMPGVPLLTVSDMVCALSL